MTSALYTRLAATAHRLLADKGQPVTLNRPSTSSPTYDRASGVATARAPATYNGFGAVFDIEQRDIDGTLVKEGDQRLMLSPLQTNGSAMPTPATTDTVTIGGVTYSIQPSKRVAPAGVNVLFDLIIRGV